MNIQIEVPSTFDIEKAVCNHRLFMMAPNTWIPSTKTLVRPLRLPDHHSVTVSISQPFPTILSVTLHEDHHSHSHHQPILDQVKRMLRLSKEEEEHVREFHRLHDDAAKRGFGRLFRNPTLFEDIIKTLLMCGCRFEDSLEMAKNLCKLSLKRKRGRSKKSYQEPQGNFPTAQEIAKFDGTKLKKDCGLGYRADWILKFAEDVSNGKLKLDNLEKIDDGDTLYNKLIKIKGIGDFVACNVLICMGFYHKVPTANETVKHIKQIHQREECVMKNAKAMVKEIYDKYAPFQALAYWLELVECYEHNLGKLSMLKECDYKNVAGSLIDRTT